MFHLERIGRSWVCREDIWHYSWQNDKIQIIFRLTKNGHGTMAAINLEKYAELMDDTELKSDEAGRIAASSGTRRTHGEVFIRLKEGLDG